MSPQEREEIRKAAELADKITGKLNAMSVVLDEFDRRMDAIQQSQKQIRIALSHMRDDVR